MTEHISINTFQISYNTVKNIRQEHNVKPNFVGLYDHEVNVSH